MKPLSAEQLGWSLMVATGLAEVEIQALRAAWQAKDPKFYPSLQDNATWFEQRVHERLSGNVNAFVSLFSAPAGQAEGAFQATVEQALFINNGSVVESWLNPRTGNTLDILNQTADPDQLAEQMYLRILSRRPAPDERQLVADYLTERKDDRIAALKELCWALLASGEFRFNH